MKKGIVALLLVLALVVLVSPGIIGRLAEQSVDESLDWAGNESTDVLVTSTGFERGWFTSAGQHRVELLEGELYDTLLDVFDSVTVDSVPVLLIDTRLDHGLIPVSSMGRENGSLMPGLGSAVSTLSLELADEAIVPLPGTLYTAVGLTGGLQSRLVLGADGIDADGVRFDWGSAEFVLTSDPRSGEVSVNGALNSLAMEAEKETAIVGKIDVDFDLVQSGFGFMVGPAKFALDSFAVIDAANTMKAGPVYIESDSSVDDGRLDADITFRIENATLPTGGAGALDMLVRLENVDAASLGNLKRRIGARSGGPNYEQMAMLDIEGDLMRLLANGMTLHLDQLDIASPWGQITSRFSASVEKSAVDDYTWTSALLALDASADISLPAALIDMATQMNPDMHAVIGMGYLRKQGDYYVMSATFERGLLTVNGAPMQLPLTGL